MVRRFFILPYYGSGGALDIISHGKLHTTALQVSINENSPPQRQGVFRFGLRHKPRNRYFSGRITTLIRLPSSRIFCMRAFTSSPVIELTTASYSF